MMHRSKWFFHPIFIFILSILALVTSLFLYIYWYMEVSTGLKATVLRFNLNPDQVLASQTWVVILVLSILVGIILMGFFMIFVFSQKTLQLYRIQNNFINNFTHELKTPVTSLKLYLETFLKHELSRKDRSRYLKYMLSDVGRLSENINSILNIAKIESKSYGGEFVTLELVQVVRRFLDNNAHHFQDCDIEIVNPSGESFSYRINLSLFEMLLMNLLNNAVKYNTSKTPRVRIVFERKSRKLDIGFMDNGIGLEKPELKRIFKKFYQVGTADDMTAKGSGLGLYLVQNIAKIHKGKITAQSRGENRGSVFKLSLPLGTYDA